MEEKNLTPELEVSVDLDYLDEVEILGVESNSDWSASMGGMMDDDIVLINIDDDGQDFDSEADDDLLSSDVIIDL